MQYYKCKGSNLTCDKSVSSDTSAIIIVNHVVKFLYSNDIRLACGPNTTRYNITEAHVVF